ncbi:YolD-like family protein [Metabacillus sp. GX 13764]|uniref:YolD-like family protein n=1 Tax=Metabacillus kandeliae TaxID=2900151 RepID=UPI001E3C81D5|nr:YolD-like family protein [Metabacillus kandeliae]MCD7033267.1 YolD-like family protein [Metabacillus kandeliae]
MIRDRGNIKWTSMMLPEHVKLLREWAKEEEFQPRPELDEQELEILDEAIGMAMEENREVHITVHQNNRLTKYSGKIHYADALTHSIRIIDTEGKRQTIKLDSIIKIEE